MIKIYNYGEVSNDEIFARDNIATNVEGIVSDIIANVINRGDEAIFEYALKFDKADLKSLESKLSVEKGSICAPTKEGWVPEVRKNAPIKDNVLLETTDANSPSTAGWIALGHSNNGWSVWKDYKGQPIDIYRK